MGDGTKKEDARVIELKVVKQEINGKLKDVLDPDLKKSLQLQIAKIDKELDKLKSMLTAGKVEIEEVKEVEEIDVCPLCGHELVGQEKERVKNLLELGILEEYGCFSCGEKDN